MRALGPYVHGPVARLCRGVRRLQSSELPSFEDDGCLWSEAFADNMPVYEMKPDFLPHAFGIHPEWLST
jgi:hypothetical protein